AIQVTRLGVTLRGSEEPTRPGSDRESRLDLFSTRNPCRCQRDGLSVLLALALLGAISPAPAAIASVQSASQDPTSASSVAVKFPAAQSAGELNVTAVG